MELKNIIKDKKSLIEIFFIGILNITFNYIYYHYILNLNEIVESKAIIQFYFGGIFVNESCKILKLIIYMLPIILISIFIGIKLVNELKDNFVYIFTRTQNRAYWLKKIFLKDIIYITFFELISFSMFLILEGQAIFIDNISWSFVANILFMNWLQYLNIILLIQVISLYTKDDIGIISGLLLVIFPIILTGVLYESGFSNANLGRYFIFNRGIYNYHYPCSVNSSHYNYIFEFISLNNMNKYVSLVIQVIFMNVLYFIGRNKLKRYELL